MALKTLMLRKKINDAQKQLEELRKKDAEFLTRETELETAIGEAQTDEERSAVEESVETFEQEKAAHETAKVELEESIRSLEADLQEAENAAPQERKKENPIERKDEIKMNTRAKFFGMTAEQQESFIAREDVKEFLTRTREMMAQKRAITGSNLLIPTVVLGLIRENVINYSKLYRHVNVRAVSGKARQVVMGTIPEAVWTEMCANLNDIDLVFNAVEMDGYKVGAYVAVCNAMVEDSDIDLAYEIIVALSQAIGIALDKAILFGTGTKMPLGIATRLAQTQAPATAPAGARPWVNLSTTNVITVDADATDVDLFKDLVVAFGAAKGAYSRGEKFWAMNEATYTSLIASALTINAAGALAAGVDGTMPVIGGDIEVLNFIPDNTIIGGYGDLYLLAERAGTSIARSEEAMFVEDQTVFKATARYDGAPVIAEAFVAVGLGAAPGTTVNFAADEANN